VHRFEKCAAKYIAITHSAVAAFYNGALEAFYED
jgi:hypothetical protein